MAGIPLDKLARLLRGQKVAGLGTIRDGYPLVTHVLYAPALDFSALYLLTSTLSFHTQDFLEDPRVGVLIADPDTGGGDPRLLLRVSLWGRVESLPEGSPEESAARGLYLEKFPDAEMTMELDDFALYKVVFEGARFVAGFGQAYTLTPEHLMRASGSRIE